MKSPKPLSVVVDASVARSAGESEHPLSSSCRRMMMDILKICHRLVMTDEIQDQWKKHASRFARRWRAAMVARKKRVTIKAEDLDDSIRTYLSAAGMSEGDREKAMRDVCLLQAAFAADRIIVTRDDKFRKILQRYPTLERIEKRINWVNPARDTAPAIQGLNP